MKQTLDEGALYRISSHGKLALLPMRWTVHPFLRKTDSINLISAFGRIRTWVTNILDLGNLFFGLELRGWL